MDSDCLKSSKVQNLFIKGISDSTFFISNNCLVKDNLQVNDDIYSSGNLITQKAYINYSNIEGDNGIGFRKNNNNIQYKNNTLDNWSNVNNLVNPIYKITHNYPKSLVLFETNSILNSNNKLFISDDDTTLNANNYINFGNNVNINGILSVSNFNCAGSINVSSMCIQKKILVKNTLENNNTLYIGNTLSVNNDLLIQGNLTVNQLNVTSANITNDLSIGEDISCTKIIVEKDLFSRNINLKNHLSISNNLESIFNTNTNTLHVNDTLKTFNISIKNNVTTNKVSFINYINDNDLKLPNNAIINNMLFGTNLESDVILASDSLINNLNIRNNLSIANEFIISENLYSNSIINIGQNLLVNDKITAKNINLKLNDFGINSINNGLYSTTFGSECISIGNNSFSGGFKSQALAENTLALGNHSIAESYSETAFGMFNTRYIPISKTKVDLNDRVFVIGNGSEFGRSDALTIYKSGNIELNGNLNTNNSLNINNTTIERNSIKVNGLEILNVNSSRWEQQSMTTTEDVNWGKIIKTNNNLILSTQSKYDNNNGRINISERIINSPSNTYNSRKNITVEYLNSSGNSNFGNSIDFTQINDNTYYIIANEKPTNTSLNPRSKIFIYSDVLTNDSLNNYLQLWLELNKEFGSTIYDSSENEIHGKSYQMISNNNYDNNLNKAYQFDGSYSYISFPDVNITKIKKYIDQVSFTFNFWIKLTDVDNTNLLPIFEAYADDTNCLKIFINTNNKIKFKLVNELESTNTILTKYWNNIIIDYDHSTGQKKIYINGILNGSEIISNNLDFSNISNIYIGVNNESTPKYFKGLINNFKLYNISISSEQILNLYKNSDYRYNLTNWFKLENSATDSIGPDNGSLNNTTSISNYNNILDKALSFNGSNSSISFSSFPENVPIGSSDFSISLWINPSTKSGTNGIIGWGDYSSTDQSNSIAIIDNNQIKHFFNNNDTNSTSITLSSSLVNTWTYLVVTFSSNTIKIYKDLELLTTNQLSDLSLNINGSDFNIGQIHGGNNYNGKISDIRIYNKEISLNDIKDLYLSSSYLSPIGYWKLNSTCYTVDSSDNAFHGINNNVTFIDNLNDLSISKNTASFNVSNNSYIDIRSTTNNINSELLTHLTSSFTINFWINLPLSTNTSFSIFNVWQTDTNLGSIIIYKNNSNILFSFDTNNYLTNNCQLTIPDNNWHNIICKFDHNNLTMEIYLDKVVQSSNVSTTLPNISSATFVSIGRRINNSLTSSGGTDYGTFFMTDFRIYNRTLNQIEINSIYDNNYNSKYQYAVSYDTINYINHNYYEASLVTQPDTTSSIISKNKELIPYENNNSIANNFRSISYGDNVGIDKNYAVVSASTDAVFGPNAGSVYIFKGLNSYVIPSKAYSNIEGFNKQILELFYNLNNNLVDSSLGTKYNGTNVDLSITKGKNEEEDTAYNFNGTSSYIDILSPGNNNNSGILSIFSGSFTIGFWVKFGVSTGTWQSLFNIWQSDSTDGMIIIQKHYSTNRIQFSFDRYNYNTNNCQSQAISDSNWHHIVCTYNNNNNTAKIYLDKVFQESNITTVNVSSATYISFGRSISLSNINNGGIEFGSYSLDELRIYNVELDSKQIIDLYNDQFSEPSYTAANSAINNFIPDEETVTELISNNFCLEDYLVTLVFDSGATSDNRGITFTYWFMWAGAHSGWYSGTTGRNLYCEHYLNDDILTFIKPTFVVSWEMNAKPWEGYTGGSGNKQYILAYDENNNILWQELQDLNAYTSWDNWKLITINMPNVKKIVFRQPYHSSSGYSRFWPSVDNIKILNGADINLYNPEYNFRKASSVFDSDIQGYSHGRGKLSRSQGWSAGSNDLNQWYQIDATRLCYIVGVVTQGRSSYSQRVTSFKVAYGNTENDFDEPNYLTNINGNETFTGNSDSNTILENKFNEPIYTRYIRIYPQTWNSHISMRSALLIESYGIDKNLIARVRRNDDIITLGSELRLNANIRNNNTVASVYFSHYTESLSTGLQTGDIIEIGNDTTSFINTGQYFTINNINYSYKHWYYYQQLNKITASDKFSNDRFGSNLNINNYNILIGAPNKNTNSGKIYIYTIDTTLNIVNNEIQFEAYDNGINKYYGSQISLSNNVFAIRSIDGIYVYNKILDSWNFSFKITNTGNFSINNMSDSISLYNKYLLISLVNINTVYLYQTNDYSVWTLKETHYINTDNFGKGISMNNNYYLIGEPNYSDSGNNSRIIINEFIGVSEKEKFNLLTSNLNISNSLIVNDNISTFNLKYNSDLAIQNFTKNIPNNWNSTIIKTQSEGISGITTDNTIFSIKLTDFNTSDSGTSYLTRSKDFKILNNNIKDSSVITVHSVQENSTNSYPIKVNVHSVKQGECSFAFTNLDINDLSDSTYNIAFALKIM